ncbi:GTPase HRas [Diplonema papillatum]|nr:GTPase HRas [Diplonema papillatum]
MVVPSGAASRTPAGTGTHLLKRVHEALRWSGRGTSCRATVITRTASGWAAAGDVTVAAGEEECCADIAARAALYGAPEDTLRQFAAALRLSSHAAQHRGKPPGLRCTFPFRVADRVAAYCDAGALASILRVNSHVFDNRDELVYGTLCRLAFPRASPAPPFCAAAAQAPAQSCSSVDEYVSPTSVSHRWLDTLRTARKAKPAGAIHVENATIVVSGVFRASAAGTAVYAARGSTICGARDVLLWEAGQDGELIVLLSFARAPAAAAEQARLMAAVHAAVVAEDAAASARPQARLPAAGKQPAAKPSNHFRVAVIGPGNVGKSAISVRYVQDTYVDNYDPNICDTYKKQDRVDATVCFLEIVDMAGQEEYASLRAQYYQRSDGFLAVFSIDDANSVDELLSEYRDLLRERSGN